MARPIEVLRYQQDDSWMVEVIWHLATMDLPDENLFVNFKGASAEMFSQLFEQGMITASTPRPES